MHFVGAQGIVPQHLTRGQKMLLAAKHTARMEQVKVWLDVSNYCLTCLNRVGLSSLV